MSELKKEWKATNDEATRNAIGQQIDEINTKLKDMDSSIGNFQRNVGNYQSALDGVKNSSVSFGEAMSQMNQQIEPTKQKFESVGKIASGVASGFAAVQGTMALLGVESKDFEKTLLKVQSAMAIAQGISGLGGLVEGLGKAKVAFNGLNTAVQTVNKTMGKTGWIAIILAVVTAITLIVTALKNKREEVDANERAITKLNKANEQFDIASDRRAKNLEREIKIAKAKGATDEEIAKKRIEANQKELDEAQKIYDKANKQYLAARDRNQMGIRNAKGKKTTDEDVAAFKEQTDKALEILTQYKEKHKDLLVDLEVAQIQKNKKNSNTGSTTSEVDVEKSKAETLLKTTEDYFKDKKQLLTEKYNEDLALLEKYGLDTTNLTKKYQADLAALDKKEIVDYSKEADEKIAELERVTKRELELNSISTGSTQEKAAKAIEIEKKLAEDKLKILEENLAKAKTGEFEGDETKLEQDIADAKLAIQKATYAEEERMRQENLAAEEAAAQKRIDITNKVSQALSAAGSVTQGILEITQAAAEKDGEITEKEAKKIKGMQIAIATMNMLAGITAAISGCFTTKTGPWDIAIAAVQAATIAATGTANIMKIKNTDLTGSVSSGAQAAVTPNSNIYGTDLPMSYVRNVTTASEVDSLNQDQRVYILESDIQASNKRVSVRESESSF